MIQNAYTSTPVPGNPSQSEAWALVEAAKRMAEASAAGNNEATRAALRLNWRLWTIFQAELSENESLVPEQIRENMLRLCLFVDKTSVAQLAEPTREGIETLVNVNRNIAQGLLASADRVTAEQQSAMAAADQSVRVSTGA